MEINIYCDESCHLPNDGMPIMVLGAVWCPKDEARRIAVEIREIKKKHNLPPFFEVKWTKVSKGKEEFYLDLVDYFFQEKDLHFRAVIAEKEGLNHEEYGQNHDDWYYKMYFNLLKVLFAQSNAYNIYLDIKDTQSNAKVRKLHQVLCNNQYDFNRQIIRKIQNVHSHELEQVQLVDLLSGVVSYTNRKLSGNQAKLSAVKKVREKSGYTLLKTTLVKEDKFNVFRWECDWKEKHNG